MVMARANDTDPAAQEIQLRLLRDVGLPRRLGLAFSLSETVIELARSAVRRSLPGASDSEVRLRFVELHYGADLARELRAYLARLQR